MCSRMPPEENMPSRAFRLAFHGVHSDRHRLQPHPKEVIKTRGGEKGTTAPHTDTTTSITYKQVPPVTLSLFPPPFPRKA